METFERRVPGRQVRWVYSVITHCHDFRRWLTDIVELFEQLRGASWIKRDRCRIHRRGVARVGPPARHASPTPARATGSIDSVLPSLTVVVPQDPKSGARWSMPFGAAQFVAGCGRVYCGPLAPGRWCAADDDDALILSFCSQSDEFPSPMRVVNEFQRRYPDIVRSLSGPPGVMQQPQRFARCKALMQMVRGN